MKRPSLHPDELAMQLDAMLPADRALFDAAVAAVAERQALGWRFRLVMIESVMMAGLVLIAGLLVDQPTSLFTQASVTVGIACFASGLVLIWLSSVTSGLDRQSTRLNSRH